MTHNQNKLKENIFQKKPSKPNFNQMIVSPLCFKYNLAMNRIRRNSWYASYFNVTSIEKATYSIQLKE